MVSRFLLLLICVCFSPIAYAQINSVTVSGTIKDKTTQTPLPYVNIVLKNSPDSAFISGTITTDEGLFTLTNVKPGNYYLQLSYTGYITKKQALFIGSLSAFIDVGTIELEVAEQKLGEVEITGKADEIGGKMDKKTFSVDDNLAQIGGSVLQVMQNLPGVTVQDGKVQIRGSDKVVVLIDGKQTALTGFGSQSALDNIPASAIEKIEIINNPSAKYDANGNAGIINIILKKNSKDGFNGKASISLGLGALLIKKQNLPTIRPQFQATPKVNPSLALNYRKNKINIFAQGDFLYNPTLNKNEFVTRTYNDGQVILQQTKRNRQTTVTTARAGFDWDINPANTFNVTGLFSSEKILDNGDEPFFANNYATRSRLWQFLEDELKTTVTASTAYQHKFKQPGHLFNTGLNYTWHQEDEKYFFTNILPTYTGYDSFKLLSDEHVIDYNFDYLRPLKYGRLEAGIKYRHRIIPTSMLFKPGLNSPLDTNAGGWAKYKEDIPAVYGTYVFENEKLELEAGVRVEYVAVNYFVDPNHNTYKSDGYQYIQPFPNVRVAYKINGTNKLSLFYNRRVDRPNEFDIRVFPKYDDAEIIKIGDPALRPQFTNLIELGYKTSWKTGYLYAAGYYRAASGTITRIATTTPGSTLIYSIMQNAGKSYTTGVELMLSHDVAKWFSFNINLNGYYNYINAFSVPVKYPISSTFYAGAEGMLSGNIKGNIVFHLPKQFDIQITAIYLAPDLIPQGQIAQRFSLDSGLKKQLQKGKGELFLNATDIANTMVIKKTIRGSNFNYISADYYETQVVRLGYSYKF